MKKSIVLVAATLILIIGGQQQAWASSGHQKQSDDYRAFRKIVRVLDTIINDDCRRGKNQVVVKKYVFPKRRVCYYKGPYEVCRFDRGKNRNFGYKWNSGPKRHDHRKGR